MSRYRTCHQGCATVLRFVLGDENHRRTYRRSDGRLSFEFNDPEHKAAEVAQAFFLPEGVAVSNARELLACDRAIRTTVGAAIEGDGEWRNG